MICGECFVCVRACRAKVISLEKYVHALGVPEETYFCDSCLCYAFLITMSKNIVYEGWLTKSPPTKRIWRTVSSTFDHTLPCTPIFVDTKLLNLYRVLIVQIFLTNFLFCDLQAKSDLQSVFMLKSRITEMAEKVVRLATVGGAPWSIFSRLLRGPELQAPQGHNQLRFVRTGIYCVNCITL